MSTKKKLWISIGTLCVAVIAVLGITIGVLAAQTHTVQNQFQITYSATNVSATVSAAYTTKENKTASSNSITFAATEETAQKSLTIDAATLTANDNYVIYTYTFKNDNTAGGGSMTVTMADNSTITGSNVNVKYLKSTESGKTYADITSAENTDTAETMSLTIAADSTGYFYVLVEIADVTLNVNFTSSISWTLVSAI